MGKNCENIRQLLVELEYGELDEMDATAVQAHLEQCPGCAERRDAYRAVRADLRAWDAIEDAPSRVTFVAMRQPQAAPRPGLSRWTRGLAVAASFLLGLLLASAFVNLEVSTGTDGWHVSTSLMPRPQVVQEARPSGSPATPIGGNPRVGSTPVQGTIPVQNGGVSSPMSQADLDSWLDARLQARGWPTGGPVPIASLTPEQVAPILDDLIAERETRMRALVQEIVHSSERKQREEVEVALAGLYQTFDAQRANDLVFLAGELGLLQENTGMELQRTNAAIDYLITRAAQNGPRQEPPR